MCLNSGDIIVGGRYKIDETLGEGGSGKTYLAQDLNLPTEPDRVVKEITPSGEDAEKRFNREAEALYELGSHPQIPELYACFQENDKYYLVQEYIDGHDLTEEVKQGKPWSEDEVIKLLREILEILEFVHKQDIKGNQLIHRDITPSNLMRRKEDGKIFLIDFGTVKEIRTLPVTSGSDLSRTDAFGKDYYIPPEAGRVPPTPPYDIYSVGIIGIQALKGLDASNINKDKSTCEVILRYEIPGEPKVRFSKKLEEVLYKMVRYKPKERYQSVEDVLNDLNKLKKSPPPTLKQVLGLWYVRLIVGGQFVLVVLFVLFGLLGIRTSLSIKQADSDYKQGEELLGKKQYEEAIKSYEKTIQSQPKIYEAWIQRGFALGQLQPVKAQEKLNSCIAALEIQRRLQVDERKEEYLEALNCQGTALFSMGRIDEAIATYEKIIDIDPKHQHILNNKGEALIAKFQKTRQKQFLEEAIKDLNKEVDLYPDSHVGWTNKGKAHELLGQYADSVQAYQQALNIKPDYQQAIEGLKQVENKEKK